jgi:hypothetical protein
MANLALIFGGPMPSRWFLEAILNTDVPLPHLGAPTTATVPRRNDSDGQVQSRSPIGQLCPELLQEILFHTLDNPHMLCRNDQVTLSSFRCVSRYWNNVALSLPMVWKGLVVYSDHGPLRPNQMAQKVFHWLSRGGVMPKRLSFASKLVYDTDAEKTQFFALLAMKGNWERLDLNELSEDDLQSLLTPFKFAVPGHPCTWFCLRELSLYGDKMDASLFTGGEEPSLHAAQSTLEQLRASDCLLPMSHLEKVLSMSTSRNVQGLHLRNTMDHVLLSSQRPSIHNTNIRALSVEGAASVHALYSMTFPLLECLEVTGIGEYSVLAIQDFLRRSGSNLQVLALRDLSWRAPNIFSIFSSPLPRCREIHLGDGNILRFVDIWAVILALPALDKIVLMDEPIDDACHDVFLLAPWENIGWNLQRRMEKRPNAPPLLLAHHGLAPKPEHGRVFEVVESLVTKHLISFSDASPLLAPRPEQLGW